MHTAVLAGVIVANKDLFAAQAGAGSRTPDQMREAYHRRAMYTDARRVNDLVVQLQHFGLSAQHQYKGALYITNVERLIVLVEDQDGTVQDVSERRKKLPIRILAAGT